ncbi:hypothetical protein ACFQ3K_08840 [Brucella gallinifaecis]|uniref:hypothetical protein n=1 Tax=Brucella gallinifaecis TaxID=215590 RepID=UPI001456C299|nr:hypothetical protein [Brucella gallinifaecis]
MPESELPLSALVVVDMSQFLSRSYCPLLRINGPRPKIAPVASRIGENSQQIREEFGL